MLVAPTEPALLKTLGPTSDLPERHGVDFLIVLGRNGLAGVQRKEWKDLLQSVGDGRLTKEIGQMNRLTTALLLVEGRPPWTINGELQDHYLGRWSRRQFRGLLCSVQSKGVMVLQTDNIEDTAATIQGFETWVKKEKHDTLDTRPRPPKTSWGTSDHDDWQMWLAQTFPKVSAGRARVWINHFGGRLPIGFTCSKQDLAAVPGFGPKITDAVWSALEGGNNGERATSDVGLREGIGSRDDSAGA